MWRDLPAGAAQNWGALASRNSRGRMQVANLLYDMKKRATIVGTAANAFLRYLDLTLPHRPSFQSISGLSVTEMKLLRRVSALDISHFVDANRTPAGLNAHATGPDVTNSQFDVAANLGSVSRIVNTKIAIRDVSLHCQVTLRPGSRMISQHSADAYQRLARGMTISAKFRHVIESTAVRFAPNQSYSAFFTFRHGFDAVTKLTTHNEATHACMAAGLSGHYPGTPLVRIIYQNCPKPNICRRPTVFSAGAYNGFSSYDHADGFGRTRVLGTGAEGVPEFILLADAAMVIDRIEHIGALEKPKIRVNAVAICADLDARRLAP